MNWIVVQYNRNYSFIPNKWGTYLYLQKSLFCIFPKDWFYISRTHQVNCAKSLVDPSHYSFRDFNKFNVDEFLSLIDIYHFFDIDQKLNIFNIKILNLLDVHCPVKTVRIAKNKASLLTDNIKTMMKIRDQAKSKLKKIQTNESHTIFKEKK